MSGQKNKTYLQSLDRNKFEQVGRTIHDPAFIEVHRDTDCNEMFVHIFGQVIGNTAVSAHGHIPVHIG